MTVTDLTGCDRDTVLGWDTDCTSKYWAGTQLSYMDMRDEDEQSK
jgi:hypothetical protein